MSLVKEQVVSQRGSGDDRTAASIAVAAGDILIAVCTSQDSNTNNLPVAGVKFNTTEDFTLVKADGGSGGSGQPVRIEIWRLNNPTATTADVEAWFASGINESTLTVYRISGADQTTPINGTPDSDTGSGFAPAMSITTDVDDTFLIGGLCSESSISGVGTGQTADATLTDQSYENSTISSEAGGAAGAQAHSYDMGSGGPYAQACVAIAPAAGGGNAEPTIAPNTADATDFGSDGTPTLEFTGSDTDDDDLTYEIQIDNNSDLSSPILSKASNADAGFANTVSGGDTDPFNAGEKVSFTVQAGDELSPGTYYWRARVKDPSGSDTYSSYTTIRSFVINAAPTVAQDTADANDFATDTTPTLEFTGSDTDDDDLTYEIQIDNDSDCSSPILDKTSDADAGFANDDDGGDSDPFTAGEQMSYTVQGGDALAAGTYYWRVRAKDPSGTNAYGAWSSIRSFDIKALPTVTTQAADVTGETTATGNGNITDDGNDTPIKRGFVYDTSTQSAPGNVAPGSSGYASEASDSGTFSEGAFTKAITGLTSETTYYTRAFVQTATGYAYGDEVNFTTNAPSDVFDTSVALEAGGNQNTFASAMEVAANSNRLLVASISVQDSNHASLPVISLKWGTQNFVKVRHDEPVANVRSEIWYLLNPDAGIKDVYIECNGSCWKGVVLSSYYNMKQQAPNADTGDTGTGTGPSVEITVAEDDSVVIDALSSEAARSALGTNQDSLGTEQGQSFENVSASRKEGQNTGATTMSATIGGSEAWAMSVTAFTVESNDGTAELRGDTIPLIVGHEYRLTMLTRSTREQDINVKIQDSALANECADVTKTIPANTWTPFNFTFTAVATDAESVIRITLNMESIQDFYLDRVKMIDLTVEQKQYRIMRIQGSMIPGSFVQTLTLREKTDAETA